jgi:Chaperone of endosialidase
VPQLGSGFGSGYPQTIDTRQTFENMTTIIPDGPTRVDAEVLNDDLAATVNIETTLGTNPQGTFGSVAARLQQFLPGGGTTPLLFPFTSTTLVSIPGTTHRLATPTLFVQLYDNGTPSFALQPNTVSVDVLSYDVTITLATSQSGAVALAASAPQYTQNFTNQSTVTVLGSTHLLGTAFPLVAVYTQGGGTTQVLQAASVTVHPSTQDVTVTFGTPQSGALILSAAGPRHLTPFTSQTVVTIPGTTHLLASNALLYQIYDSGTPAALVEPDSVSVHPTTFDVTVTFLTPQSGTIALVRSTLISGLDFDIRDGGITDESAVRVYSDAGTLNLQMGSGDALTIANKHGDQKVTITDAGQVGLGTAAPAALLHLTADSALKPTTTTWTVVSDARIKEVLRPFMDGLALLLQIEPLWYRYNGRGGMRRDLQEHVGVLAQAVEPLAPYLISRSSARLDAEDEAETDLLTYNGHAMTFILINAVKELAAQNQVLLERVSALEAHHPPPTEEPTPSTTPP